VVRPLAETAAGRRTSCARRSAAAVAPSTFRRRYRLMVRDPELFARGTVRHPDHATIELHGWHRVVMNTENRASAMRHVAFLD
jgi:hypothetical protein